MEKSKVIFGNEISQKDYKKALKSKNGYLHKYGNDLDKIFNLSFEKIKPLDFLGVKNISFTDEKNEEFDPKAFIVGNIRMGFGHYRISIAIASAAKALGFNPYWLDLASFDCTGSKMIRHQNNLYSMASKLSQKSHLFNHFYWEPLNCEGFKKLSYNAKDQKNSELLTPIFTNIPKDIPYVATHAWPSQGAIHANMQNVVNAIPDNWPMALHLSEGAIHAVQTPFAYTGYKILDGFDKKVLKPMDDSQLKMVGHFIDHELLVHLDKDNLDRIKRRNENKPIRILVPVGGAGAGFNYFKKMIEFLKPYVDNKQVLLLVNFGDHQDVYHKMVKKLPFMKDSKKIFDDFDGLKEFNDNLNDDQYGIVSICHKDIFGAVYSTNLLMPKSDLLVTKPSELAYYPIPKLFMRHIGGHEVYGAICGRELGDSLRECEKMDDLTKMLSRVIDNKDLIIDMAKTIMKLNKEGIYDGAYKCVKLAAKMQD